MYTFIEDEGVVIRDSDQVIVSPVFSAEDLGFIEYIAWVNQGNTPADIPTRQ